MCFICPFGTWRKRPGWRARPKSPERHPRSHRSGSRRGPIAADRPEPGHRSERTRLATTARMPRRGKSTTTSRPEPAETSRCLAFCRDRPDEPEPQPAVEKVRASGPNRRPHDMGLMTKHFRTCSLHRLRSPETLSEHKRTAQARSARMVTPEGSPSSE